MSYRVKLNVFEGPFDLLVYLIEHAEMSIYDIQISEIVKQYMEHVKAMQITDVNVSSEFMVLAAALLEIKSKMLLPRAVPECRAEVFVWRHHRYSSGRTLCRRWEHGAGSGWRCREHENGNRRGCRRCWEHRKRRGVNHGRKENNKICNRIHDVRMGRTA